jgi:UDP-N-acetylglucosamine diphosphorylase / glucose-1-phosphate thymidylyltransferase / UDP-N-acetylgalactosamine diphosphorylase / glucosamine-1-phosphate N-acetyltransferase / galactosamine-1-phosphate N-acetyltransferase
MHIWFDAVPELPALWPLNAARPLGDLRVANHRFAEWQWQEVRDAGLSLARTADAADAVAAGHAWIAQADWQAFAAQPALLHLVDARGELLAWRPGSGGGTLRASASRLVCTAWDLLALHEQIVGGLKASRILGELSPHAHVDGVLVLGRGSRVLPGVYIEGQVLIGDGCKIGPNCHLRGATAIGDKCHVGQGVEIKNSILGQGTNVGHLSYVGDSILGDRVNFGAGTVVSNLRHDGANHRTLVAGALVDTGRRKFGCLVGDGCHTGIHTAIYPGRKLGMDSSTRPAAVVKHDVADGQAV